MVFQFAHMIQFNFPLLAFFPHIPPPTLPFLEFVAVMSRKVNATYTSDQVKNAFKIFEGEAPSGHIRAEALMRSLTSYGTEKLTEEQAQELVSQLEPDVNGLINYSDYVDMMMSE